MATCMTDSGFAASVQEDGGLKIDAGAGQDAAYDAALAECEAQSGQPTIQPWTDDELEQLYDESLAAYDCLLGEGYRPTPPVSREVFMDAYRDGRAPWMPHLEEETQIALPDDVCPQPSLSD